jgi:hypothetical protein
VRSKGQLSLSFRWLSLLRNYATTRAYKKTMLFTLRSESLKAFRPCVDNLIMEYLLYLWLLAVLVAAARWHKTP